MKVKISRGVSVELRTLVKFEWRKYYPVLVVHERFETRIKWVIRIIAFVGIGISLLSFSKWYYSLGVSVAITLIGLLFERTLFEYTTLLSYPLPDFDIDFSQWQTNGFMIPKHKGQDVYAHVGPSFKDEEYAIKIFNYLRSWSGGVNIDKENKIVLSFIIEPDERYSMYIYSSASGAYIERQFKIVAEMNKFDKKGKRQQQFVMQHIFWHTFPFKEGYFIKRFLNFQKEENKPFYLTPSVTGKNNQPPEFLLKEKILKFKYKLKNRNELTKHDVEHNFAPVKN